MVSYITSAFLILAITSHVLCRVDPSCECGLSGTSNRIIGGRATRPHQFPWMVVIYKRDVLHCGGAIINSLYILTAGHCVRWSNYQQLVAHVGVHDRVVQSRDKAFQVKEVKLHPDFYSYKLYDINDIALLKLDRRIQFSNIIRPICLPKKGSNYDSKWATVAGWGVQEETNESVTVLKETAVKVLSNDECSKTSMKLFVSPTVMCAYKKGADSCQGDSGGPLTIEREPGKMEIIGIVSWGMGCASAAPGLYTKVTEYLWWIMQNTADGDFCVDKK